VNRSVCAALALVTMFLAGCADVDQRGSGDCVQWLIRLDAAIDRAGVRDVGAYRIPGFPYLRADRFWASFRDEVKDDPAALAAWADRLRTIDATARSYELRNLPEDLLASLGVADRRAALARSNSCAAELDRTDLAAPSQRAALVTAAAVPDNYDNWHRVVGLYPLATLPLSIAINRWQDDTVGMFWRAAAGAPVTERIMRYEPRGRPAGAREIAGIFAHAGRDRFGVPQLGRNERERLFQAFAPAFEIATSGDYDRFGPLSWGAGSVPEVDVSHPMVYRRLAFTRYGERVLVQLVYTIWFPERPPEGSLDLLAGRLDGLVFRVTLDPRGLPLIYDTIHPCGCYHMFFPTARVKAKPAPRPGIEWAFVPATLPAVDPSWRIVLDVTSRSHYLAKLGFDTGAHGSVYWFAEDDDLRALPAIDGTTRSAFGPDGIVPGTERGERLLFWPTGVEDTGAMRQWGRHATAFLGRRHFDDPDLIDRRFSIVEP
jgi:hypothetical protein